MTRLKEHMKKDFFTDHEGNPIYVLGLQAHNSSTSTPMIERAIAAVKAFHGNTLEAPVYWYACEPQEGKYDYSSVRMLIHQARTAGLHLILLWFGFNKNGHPNYAPDYVKLHPEIYRLAHGVNGAPVASMAPDCMATREADGRAFAGMMRVIKEEDEEFGTVLAVQIENEIGFANTDMDYSEEAQALYNEPLPELMRGITLEDCGTVTDHETWRGHFGRHAHEAFSAYCHAMYIEELAAEAKRIYPIPLTINVMLGEQGIEEAGHSYNAGAAVGRMLELYKKAAPSVDLICPDMYCLPETDYMRVCERYSRPDNPLFIPECPTVMPATALHTIKAVVNYHAIGICCFGAETTLAEDGTLLEEAKAMALTMKLLSRVSPLLTFYREPEMFHAIVQEEFQSEMYMKLDYYHVRVRFINAQNSHWALGSQINLKDPANSQLLRERGRGILIQVSTNEFYLCGAGIQLEFIKRPEPQEETSFTMLTSRMAGQLNYLHVEEGHFNENGEFRVDFIRNGDEANGDIYAHDGQLVHIVLNPSYL